MASNHGVSHTARKDGARPSKGGGLVLFGPSVPLIDPRKGIADAYREALSSIRRAGARVCLCTDGVPATLPRSMTGGHATGFLSCADGSLLVRARGGKELAAHPLPADRALDAMDRLAGFRPAWRAVLPDCACFEVMEGYVRSHAAAPQRFLSAIARSMAPSRGSYPVGSVRALLREMEADGDDPLELVATFGTTEEREHARSAMLLHRGVASYRSGACGLRLGSSSAGHGASRAELCRRLGIPQGNAVAVVADTSSAEEDGFAHPGCGDGMGRVEVVHGPLDIAELAATLTFESE